MRYALAVVVGGFMGCASADDVVPEEGEVVTKDQPTAREVSNLIARDYAKPSLHTVTARDQSDTRTRWQRTFDGIPMQAEALTVKLDGAWHTRFHREIRGPAPVRRSALITKARARAQAELPNGDTSPVFLPTYKYVQRPGTRGDNAMDYVYMIEREDLVYQVSTTDRHRIVYVDAYSGAIRGHASSVITERR